MECCPGWENRISELGKGQESGDISVVPWTTGVSTQQVFGAISPRRIGPCEERVRGTGIIIMRRDGQGGGPGRSRQLAKLHPEDEV
jgi:hypothetical protein